MNLSFMEPLISRMVDDDPAKRPTMDEVVTSFKEIVSKSSFLRLRARLVEQGARCAVGVAGLAFASFTEDGHNTAG